MPAPVRKETIHAGGLEIGIYTKDYRNEYISLTDIAKYRSIDPRVTIHNWLRGRDIVEFLGLWEVLHNPGFKRIEFDTFKENAGTNAFVFSIKDWTEKLGAIGLLTNRENTLARNTCSRQLALCRNRNALFLPGIKWSRCSNACICSISSLSI